VRGGWFAFADSTPVKPPPSVGRKAALGGIYKTRGGSGYRILITE
jgi:hypothetical protein